MKVESIYLGIANGSLAGLALMNNCRRECAKTLLILRFNKEKIGN